MPAIKGLHIWQPVVLLLALTSCSGPTLKNAVDLSKAGQTAAGAAEQAAVAQGSQFTAYQEGVVFQHAFAGAAPEAASLTDEEAANEKELTSRAGMFSSLAKAYASLGDLASYDASSAAESDVKNLFSTISAWQSSLKDAGSIVAPVAGAIAGAVQAHKVVAAADQIKVQLDNVVVIMSNPRVRAEFVTQKTGIITVLTNNAKILAANGLLSSKPIIDVMGEPLGLAAAENADAALGRSKSALVKRGIDGIIDLRSKAAVDAVGKTYDTTKQAILDLRPLHARLDAGQPLDLTQLDQIVQQLQAIAAAIAPTTTVQGAKK
jgi:hypothetical protein